MGGVVFPRLWRYFTTSDLATTTRHDKRDPADVFQELAWRDRKSLHGLQTMAAGRLEYLDQLGIEQIVESDKPEKSGKT